MDETDANDNLERESPETLKRMRTTEKTRLSKMITRISNHMEERGSRKVLRVYRNQLAEILQECNCLNSAYASSLKSENRTEEDAWQTELDTRANECFTLIEAHLLSREDEESTTSVASAHSSRHHPNERKRMNPMQQSTQNITRVWPADMMVTDFNPLTKEGGSESILTTKRARSLKDTLTVTVSDLVNPGPASAPETRRDHTTVSELPATTSASLCCLTTPHGQHERVNTTVARHNTEGHHASEIALEPPVSTPAIYRRQMASTTKATVNTFPRHPAMTSATSHYQATQAAEIFGPPPVSYPVISVNQQTNEPTHRAMNTGSASRDIIQVTTQTSIPRQVSFIPNEASADYHSGQLRSFTSNPTAKSLDLPDKDQPSNPNHQSLETPDSWIHALNTQRGSTVGQMAYPKTPKMSIQTFSGNPQEWPSFIASFKVIIHDACSSDVERLYHLRNHLTQEIRDRIGEVLLHPGLYQHALKELHRKYGNPQLVAQACSDKLLSLTSFKEDDHRSLRTFSAKVRGVVATLKYGGYSSQLECFSTIQQLSSKLPLTLRKSWGKKSWSLQPKLPNLIDFDDWLDETYMEDSRAQIKTQKETVKSPRDRHSIFAVTFEECPAGCHEPHRLENCQRFNNLTVDKRNELIKKRKLCFRCLKGGHRSVDCTQDKACPKEGCKYRHHVLLHGAPVIWKGNRASRNHNRASYVTSNFRGSTSSHASYTYLPIVPILVCANGKEVRTYGLLDSGSRVTLIREDVSKSLKLKGKWEQS